MSRTDYIRKLVVALVGLEGLATVEVLTLLDIQEWIESVVIAFTFAVILFGTYGFIWALTADGTAGSGRAGAPSEAKDTSVRYPDAASGVECSEAE